MRKKNSQKLLIGVLFLSVFFLGFFQNLNISYAQEHSETINFSQNFQIDEFSENEGDMENVTSIDIDLGSPRWNVTDIELNFTDIKHIRHIKDIETEDAGHPLLLDRKPNGYAVQINISEPTKIFGIQIYGQETHINTTAPIYVQIQGYNDISKEPNGTIYGSTFLNMSGELKWYNQSFSDPFVLSKGLYYLVINGTEMTPSDLAKYYLSINDVNSRYPNLNTWEYDSGWTNNLIGQPLLYKLDHIFLSTINPEEINMTAEINGDFHPVKNGESPETGNLTISLMNFFPNNNILHIPLKNNQSYVLIFNISYHINLKNNFFADGSVTINTDSKIRWSLDFYLNRTNGNYSGQFVAPISWENFTVLNNGDDITNDDNVTITGNIVTIKNDIIQGVNFQVEITADSSNSPFSLNFPLKSEYRIGEELTFSLNSELVGNYTFVLYGLGFPKCREYTTDPSHTFVYTFPSNASSGEWEAVVYWNNRTDAAVQSEPITVIGISTVISGGGGGGGGGGSTTVTGLDPLLVLTVSIIIIVAIAGSLTSYKMVKKLKRKRDLQMQKLRNKVLDSLNLNYIMISENASGLNVFEQFFGGKEIDPSLISGFLSAIRSFGIELTGTFQQSQTIKLEFQNSKILMNEFRHFRLILLMGENPSDDFIESLDNLAQDVEKAYGEQIRDFDGRLTKFTGIGKLIERHLNVSFLFPLKVISSEATKLTTAERSVFNKANEIMKQNNLSYIFTSFLMDDQTYEPKRIKAIFGLIDKGVFQPIRLKDQNFKQ